MIILMKLKAESLCFRICI